MKCLQWKSDFHWILRTEHRYPRTELFPLGALDFYTKKNMGLRLKDGFVRSVEEYPKFQCRIIFNIKSSPCLVPFLFKPSWFARQYSDPNQTRSTLSGRIASNSRQQYWPVRRFAQLPFLLQMREALYYRTQLLKRIATHKAKSEVSHWKIMRLGVHAGRVRPVVFARAGRPQTFAARFVPQGASQIALFQSRLCEFTGIQNHFLTFFAPHQFSTIWATIWGPFFHRPKRWGAQRWSGRLSRWYAGPIPWRWPATASVMGDPRYHRLLGFNTKSWSSMTWMIWGYPHGKTETSMNTLFNLGEMS